MPDQESLLERLIRHRVEFVIVGGFAAVAHGASLLTRDIDICCRFTPDNLLRLQEAVADLHPVHRMTTRRLPLALSRENCVRFNNLYLDTDFGPLDCLGNVLAVGDYDEVERQSIQIKLPAGRCRVLGLDALIKSKQAMGRLHDKVAVMQLRAIRERTQS